MARMQVRLIECNSEGWPNATSKVRSYITVEGDISGMRLEVIPINGTIALVAPIRLNATRENLSRVQGEIPDDYYSRFDRYKDIKGQEHGIHRLAKWAETGPVCANEFGFTRALSFMNNLEHHYRAAQRYHLLMKPSSGFDCINGIRTINPSNGMVQKRPSHGEMYVSYGAEDDLRNSRLSCHGFNGFVFRDELQSMPFVRYTLASNDFRNPKCRITPTIKAKIQHALSLHKQAEDLLVSSSAPFGPYWAIGAERNYLKSP